MSDNSTHLAIVSMASGTDSRAAGRRISALEDAASRRGLTWVELVPVPGDSPSHKSICAPSWIGRMTDNERGLFLRSLGEWAYVVWCVLRLARMKPDALIVSIPFVPLCALLLVPRWLIGGRSRLLDVRDLTWEYAEASTDSRLATVVADVYRRLAFSGARRSDAVTVTTTAQQEAMRCSKTGAPTEVARNAVSQEVLDLLGTIPRLAGPERPVSFLYAGTLGHAQAPNRLLAINEIDPAIKLKFVGSGPLSRSLEDEVEGIDGWSVSGRIPFGDLLSMYAEADVLVACLKDSPEFASAVPSKLYEYAATGRVLLFVGPGEAADVARSLGGFGAAEITPELLEAVSAEVVARRTGGGATIPSIPTREGAADHVVALLVAPTESR